MQKIVFLWVITEDELTTNKWLHNLISDGWLNLNN